MFCPKRVKSKKGLGHQYKVGSNYRGEKKHQLPNYVRPYIGAVYNSIYKNSRVAQLPGYPKIPIAQKKPYESPQISVIV